MDTVSQIKEILQNDLQGFEYCLNNKGAWSTPDGIKDLIIGMIETKSALQKYLTEFETAINARTQPTPGNFPDGWDTEWQPSFETAAIEKEKELRSARDDAATNYYNCKVDAEEKDMIAMQAIAKIINEKWTVARRNALLADAYIAHIALEETHTAYDAAFEALQEYIFNRDYVIPPGHAANSLPTLYDNRTVLID